MKSCEKDVEIFSNQLGLTHTKKNSLKLEKSCLARGKDYLYKGDQGSAIDCFMQVVQALESYSGTAVAMQAEAYAGLGRAYMNLRDLDQAKKAHERALKLRVECKSSPMEISYSYSNLGKVCTLKGEHEQALTYYQQAKDLRSALAKQTPCPLLASSWSHVGRAYSDLGNHPQALTCYEQAFVLRKQLYPDKMHPSIANSLCDMGRVLLDMKQPQEALQKYQEALAIRRIVYENQQHVSIANSIMGMARSYSALQDYVKAIQCFDEPLKITMTLSASHKYASICKLLHGLAWIFLGQGDKKNAVSFFCYAYQVVQHLKLKVSLSCPSFCQDFLRTFPSFNENRFYKITQDIDRHCQLFPMPNALEMLQWYLAFQDDSTLNAHHVKV